MSKLRSDFSPEWKRLYKEPDSSVEFNQKNLDEFWDYLYKRLLVYYNRVVLKKPYPWIDDKILSNYRFTNIHRDMDKLTVYEFNNIIKKIDDAVDDLELRKKSVLFNIILFRVFVKIDTYECFGFIDFQNPNWKSQWEAGRAKLLERREMGITNYTGSFMVNGMRRCNPDESTKNNKTLNGILLCEWFLKNLDSFYEFVKNSSSMEEVANYLMSLDGIGKFNAYEFSCSFAKATTHCNNTLVSWTQDNFVYPVIGSSKGLDLIYKSCGNLSEIEAIVYLRSIWESELKRLGLYDKFISMLPESLVNGIDLRAIEHSLCEYYKYYKLKYGLGRVKRTFKLEEAENNLKMLSVR